MRIEIIEIEDQRRSVFSFFFAFSILYNMVELWGASSGKSIDNPRSGHAHDLVR